jgi:hypothetical protein
MPMFSRRCAGEAGAGMPAGVTSLINTLLASSGPRLVTAIVRSAWSCWSPSWARCYGLIFVTKAS